MWTQTLDTAGRVLVVAAGVALGPAVVTLPTEPAPERTSHTVVDEVDPSSHSLTLHDGYWFNWLDASTCVAPGPRRCSLDPGGSCLTHVTFGPIHLVVREPRFGMPPVLSIETLPGEPITFRCASTGEGSSVGWSQFGAACDGQRGVYALACVLPGGERRVAFRVRTAVAERSSRIALLRWREAVRAAWVTRGLVALAWVAAAALGSLIERSHRRRAEALGARRWIATTHRGGGVAFAEDDGAPLQGFPEVLPNGAALVELVSDGTDDPYRSAMRSVAMARGGTWTDLARDVKSLRTRGTLLGLATAASGGLPIAWQLWR